MIKIICVGKLKENYLIEAVNDYLKRINKYHKVEIIELKDSNIKDEGIEINKYIKSGDYVVSLAIDGNIYSSIELSNRINTLFTNGNSNITFIIGGSNGIDSSILNNSDEKISFSKLTFPHGLFRVILLEQIYRAFKISNNESYHK